MGGEQYRSLEGRVGHESLACSGCGLPKGPTLQIYTTSGSPWVSLPWAHSGLREGVVWGAWAEEEVRPWLGTGGLLERKSRRQWVWDPGGRWGSEPEAGAGQGERTGPGEALGCGVVERLVPVPFSGSLESGGAGILVPVLDTQARVHACILESEPGGDRLRQSGEWTVVWPESLLCSVRLQNSRH